MWLKPQQPARPPSEGNERCILSFFSNKQQHFLEQFGGALNGIENGPPGLSE
jgi:hypothetical protein